MKKSSLFFILIILLSACSPSQQSIQITKTQVAREIFGTQTALAPTATITVTPSATKTPLPTSTSTETPLPTFTPAPPTATLNAEGVERMVLCYKASVIVYADVKAYIRILNLDHRDLKSYSYEERLSIVTRFRSERRTRSQSITGEEEICNIAGCHKKTILSVNGIKLTDQDCIDQSILENILWANGELNGGRVSGVGAFSLVESFSNSIPEISNRLRMALETIYGIDPSRLESIAAPIWQHVHDRYGTGLP